MSEEHERLVAAPHHHLHVERKAVAEARARRDAVWHVAPALEAWERLDGV